MFFQASRKVLLLPDLGARIEFRTLNSRDALEVGLSPIILNRPDSQTADEDADNLLEKAGEVACQCSVFPKIVREEVPSISKTQVALADLTDVDRLFVLDNVITMSQERFYGTNRTAFDPKEYIKLIEEQEKVSYEIDFICQRYSLSPLVVFKWYNHERADVQAIIDGAEAYKERMKIREELKANV